MIGFYPRVSDSVGLRIRFLTSSQVMLKLLAGNYIKGIAIVHVSVTQTEFHLGKNVTRSIQSYKSYRVFKC